PHGQTCPFPTRAPRKCRCGWPERRRVADSSADRAGIGRHAAARPGRVRHNHNGFTRHRSTRRSPVRGEGLMLLRSLAASCLLTAAVLASACGGGRSGPIDGDALVVSIGIGEPKSLIPSSTTESNGSDVLHALFTPLVDYDDGFRPVELAAESITSDDNRVWTIRLQPGWTFHNGEPVTADSYINAWNAGAWGPNAHDGNYFFEKILGYDDLNPRDARAEPKAKKLAGLRKVDDL